MLPLTTAQSKSHSLHGEVFLREISIKHHSIFLKEEKSHEESRNSVSCSGVAVLRM